MSFREFLKGLGLEKETIDTVMAEHGKIVTENVETIQTLKSEKLALEEKVQKNGNSEELAGQIETLKTEKAELEASSKTALSEAKKEYAIKLAISNSKTLDPIAYRAHLDVSKLEYDEAKDELKGFEDQDKAIRETKTYLFDAEATGAAHGGIITKSNADYSLANAITEHYEK